MQPPETTHDEPFDPSAPTRRPGMRFTRRSIFWLGFAVAGVLCLVALVASSLLLPAHYATEQTVELEFTIDEDFSTVRKILVRTNALKRIITMTGESEFIEQDWTALGGGLGAISFRDPQWRLELHGKLKLRTLDEYIGQSEVTLSQEVKIDPDQLHSDIELEQGSERLLDYQMTTWFMRDEANGKTRVMQRLKQEILTHAPWFAHRIADARVRQSAETALLKQEQAIRQVVEDNRSKPWLLLMR